MILRILSVLGIGWSLGFCVFMLALPGPLAPNTTDGIVVPTGAAGRIDRGLALLGDRQAKRMLITGVAPGVRKGDLARTYRVPPAIFACCVDLGGEAVDTRSNAVEAAAWLRTQRYRSVRLVTSDWHVLRADMELRATVDPGTIVLGDGVEGTPRFGTLVNEYNKLLLRRLALWSGIGA